MKKILMLASVASMIDQFNMSNIDILQKMGYEVHVAANFEFGSTTTMDKVQRFKTELTDKNIRYYNINIPRGAKNLFLAYKAYIQIKALLKENNYTLVHCHSPIGGVIGRLASRELRGYGLKVVYTAHGFHFYKGAPKKYWLFYPIEKFLSSYTDVLITINKEDYELASSKMSASQTKYIPGVGVDTDRFIDCTIDRIEKRNKLSIPEESIMILSVGELVKRKNHEIIIKAVAKIKSDNIYYYICGKGELEEELKQLIKLLNIENRVFLLGFREDIPELCKAADIYAFPSTREGLGLAGIEGMAAGLPLVSSYINGIKDYTADRKTGFCVEPYDVDGFSLAIEKLATDVKLRNKIGKYNIQVAKNFDKERVNDIMRGIYRQIMEN